MAVRTNATDVKTIIDTELTDSEVESFIADANIMVSDLLGGAGLADTRLEIIEKWITAHLIAVTKERQPIREQAGDAEIEYPDEMGQFLRMTTYGQQAISFDTTGTLASAAGKKKVTFFALKGLGDS